MTNEELVKSIQQGNTALMADLYEQNRRFIAAIVKHLQIDINNIEDAMQDAYFGLREAVNGFDERTGYKFLTYAKYYIQLSIQRGQSAALHVPEYVRITARKIKRVQNELAIALKRTPTAAEISIYMGLDIETIKKTLAAAKPVKSIYEPLAEDLTIGDTIADTAADFENEIAAADERRYICETIRAAVNSLPEAERSVIQCLYLQGKTLKEASEQLGVSVSYAQVLKNKGLRALRHPRIFRMLLDDELDRRTSFYKHRSVTAFNNTWISSTEQTVLEREHMRRNM